MPNNDYILRSDATTLVSQLPAYHGSEGAWVDQKDALDTLNAIPTADVEPVKHGYWYFRGGRPCCSVCNTKALWKDEGGTGGFSHEYVGAKSKRCPECGAKMDKEADDA